MMFVTIKGDSSGPAQGRLAYALWWDWNRTLIETRSPGEYSNGCPAWEVQTKCHRGRFVKL